LAAPGNAAPLRRLDTSRAQLGGQLGHARSCSALGAHSITFGTRNRPSSTDFSTFDLAIDLGTANTLIYYRARQGHRAGRALGRTFAIRHRRRPLDERQEDHSGRGQAEAKAMLGKVPGNIEAIRPMKDGVIADFTVTEQMLKQFIKMVHPRSRCSSPARASSSACPAARPRSSAAPSANRRWAPAPARCT
jgi:hypothetical protein